MLVTSRTYLKDWDTQRGINTSQKEMNDILVEHIALLQEQIDMLKKDAR